MIILSIPAFLITLAVVFAAGCLSTFAFRIMKAFSAPTEPPL